jgi:hypothetical protein
MLSESKIAPGLARVIRRLPSSPSSGQRAEAGYERSSLGTGALWIFLLLVLDMSVS